MNWFPSELTVWGNIDIFISKKQWWGCVLILLWSQITEDGSIPCAKDVAFAMQNRPQSLRSFCRKKERQRSQCTTHWVQGWVQSCSNSWCTRPGFHRHNTIAWARIELGAQYLNFTFKCILLNQNHDEQFTFVMITG